MVSSNFLLQESYLCFSYHLNTKLTAQMKVLFAKLVSPYIFKKFLRFYVI